MPDQMFFSRDFTSLERGKRREARTEVCRCCKVWLKDAPESILEGVVVDISRCGMCIRMLEALPPGSTVMIQLMRGENFRRPLAAPIEGTVIRNDEDEEGFIDHGIQLQRGEFRRAGSPRLVGRTRRPAPRAPRRRGQSRMHTADLRAAGRRSRG